MGPFWHKRDCLTALHFRMLAALMPVWAHVALLGAGFAALAFREWCHERSETRLRRKLGAARSALSAAEITSDVNRREATSLRLRVQSLTKEVERYRGKLPPDMRLTQVANDPTEPEGGPEAA